MGTKSKARTAVEAGTMPAQPGAETPHDGGAGVPARSTWPSTAESVKKLEFLREEMPKVAKRDTKKGRQRGSTLKDRVCQYLAHKAANPDLTHAQIAEKMGISRVWLTELLYKGRKEGLLDFSDPLDQLKFGIIPKTMRNLEQLLDEGDKTATLETAKGTIFKVYQAAEGVAETNNQFVLAIKVDMPEGIGTETPTTISGTIVGKPRALEAETIDETT